MTTTMEIGSEQTIFYITQHEVENYRRAGFEIKPLHRVRGDDIHCYIAIGPACPEATK
jgi:hypothetical protein